MQKIDSHIHCMDDDEKMLAIFNDFEVRLINNCVPVGPWEISRQQADIYSSLATKHPTRFAWITAVNTPLFDGSDYAALVIKQLEEDFANGAVGAKIWKNIGMTVRKPDGSFLQIDDPLFQPIWDYLIEVNKPLLAHLAEPRACWLPFDAANPHSAYYQTNTDWYMHLKPENPTHSDIMHARDAFLTRNPKLVFIGAHLMSLEYDLDDVAVFLDAYPNAAVDISGRFADIISQPGKKVRDFFTHYQDRILFGIDRSVAESGSEAAALAFEGRVRMFRNDYEINATYFETNDTICYNDVEYTGIALDKSVLQKFYTDNALKYYPGVFAGR